MSERKVLTKYYPPDFDPSLLPRSKKTQAGPKVQTVRLMSPFSMKCTSCGEYIYKGRKFNARKETTDEKYYNIPIYRFYIRCTGCSAEISFKTDPKNTDYECEKGAKRNFEPWRESKLAEADEQELDEQIEEDPRDAMADLEAKAMDAKTEMAIADALDEVRLRNARLDRAHHAATEATVQKELETHNLEDEEAVRQAFYNNAGERVTRIVPTEDPEPTPEIVPQTFQRTKKNKKKDNKLFLGIKRKNPGFRFIHRILNLRLPTYRPYHTGGIPNIDSAARIAFQVLWVNENGNFLRKEGTLRAEIAPSLIDPHAHILHGILKILH
ncbi:hypothetical protein FQN57_000377 [Myotisia sp. PD_48]|nr:hypothetical protein FQN57_000377 [Myotisia sp. PD_48]